MAKVIISEGKTTNEAIENGLKELNVSRNQVDIKIIEQEKRSFFSILEPRTVKVELTVKENKDIQNEIHKDNYKNKHVETNKSNTEKEIPVENLNKRKEKIEKFIKEFLNNIDDDFSYEIKLSENEILVDINGNDSGMLIGHRGETLNSLQYILTIIANKNEVGRAKVILNIDGYKDKRKKSLEELAIKVSKTVLKTGRYIKLEPMNSYERKIIHTALQDVEGIRNYSVGEDPHRRIIIEKIK